MNFKPLALLVLSTSILTACSAPKKEVVVVQPFVFQEPEPTPAFYALNPIKYDAPPSFNFGKFTIFIPNRFSDGDDDWWISRAKYC